MGAFGWHTLHEPDADEEGEEGNTMVWVAYLNGEAQSVKSKPLLHSEGTVVSYISCSSGGVVNSFTFYGQAAHSRALTHRVPNETKSMSVRDGHRGFRRSAANVENSYMYYNSAC